MLHLFLNFENNIFENLSLSINVIFATIVWILFEIFG